MTVADQPETNPSPPAVDSEAIMRRIREAIARRRAESGLSEAEFDRLAFGATPEPTLDVLRFEVERLAEACQYSGVEMVLSDVRPSPISGVIQRLRAALHEVILFYVNRHAAQQAAINRMTLQALRAALGLIEKQQKEIEQLRREHSRT
ncbi:MAG: hypothetical protein RMM31_02645 [Anaerolineae bacterium]|nr:hypothetical protein [Anaerolineae bacterium]